jgi:putative peptidoglycan lipid II flippase
LAAESEEPPTSPTERLPSTFAPGGAAADREGGRHGSTIARSAASTGAATMASRVLGLVRDQVLAALFGAGNTMDAYFIAFRVPSLLRDLFAEGAMSAAFVPTFTRYLTTDGKPAAWRLGTHVINGLIVVTGTLVVFGLIFAEPLIRLMTAADYALVPGKLDLTILLARIMLPLLMLVALAAALMGMLNSLHHFFIPALSPAMFNVMTIVFAIAVVPFAGQLHVEPITIIAVGSLAGGVAQLLVQWPPLRREGFQWRPALDWRDEGLRRMLTLMGPGTIGLAATQVNLLVNQLLATREIGAPSWLNYAFRIMYLPIGLFGVSIGTAVLPTISRHLTQRNTAAARQTVSDGLSLMMMLNVPATVGLMVLAVPIVQLLFERRAFTPADTTATAAAVQLYALGLLGYSVVRIASPAFYALGRSRTPVIVSIATMVVNAGLNVGLARFYGFRGLALGTSLAALFNAATLLMLLRRDLAGLNGGRLADAFARIALASAVMGIAAIVVERMLSALLPGTGVLLQALRLGAVIGISLVVLAVTARLLRISEFREAFGLITAKFGRGR